MKLIVTVDLSELYSEEEGESFSQAIKDEITHRIKNEVYQNFKREVKEVFQEKIVQEIMKEKDSIITSQIQEMIDDPTVKKSYSGESISVRQWIKEELTRTHLSNGTVNQYLDKQVKLTTDILSAQFKERYDLLFASQMVSKMNQLGMLKDDVAKLLLDQK